jgi:hypothetical protein
MIVSAARSVLGKGFSDDVPFWTLSGLLDAGSNGGYIGTGKKARRLGR